MRGMTVPGIGTGNGVLRMYPVLVPCELIPGWYGTGTVLPKAGR